MTVTVNPLNGVSTGTAYVQGIGMSTTSMCLLLSTMTTAKTGSSFNLFERKSKASSLSQRFQDDLFTLGCRLLTHYTLKHILPCEILCKYNMDNRLLHNTELQFYYFFYYYFILLAKVSYFTVPVMPNRTLLLKLLWLHSMD